MLTQRIRGAVALVALAALIAPVATADYGDLIDPCVLTIEANTLGKAPACGMVQIMQDDGTWEGNIFTAYITDALPICDPNDNVIGEFGGGATVVSYVLPEPGSRANPQVNLGFAMVAGSDVTHFSVTSAAVPAGVTNPDGKASVGITVQDFFDAEGATLTGANPNGYVYTSLYNTASAQFEEQVLGLSADPWGGSNDINADTGWLPIAGTVTNISSKIEFTLTAFDLANGTSSFQVTPEPGTLLLLVLGAAVIRRRF